TGSIGIFGLIPSFENTLAKIGVTTDGVKTTPLTGQPDVLGGFTPMLDTILQAGIENGYRQFLTRVAQSRHMTPEKVDTIAQGRVWDGGTARQIGLIDRFGNLSDAVAEAARRAKLDPANIHAEYLEKKPGFAAELIQGFEDDDDSTQDGSDVFAIAAAERRAVAARALGDVQRLVRSGSVQARCLECGALGPMATASDQRLLNLLIARLGL
ncbi:S49 family peptidase, partial [Sphingomonas sp. UBA4815]